GPGRVVALLGGRDRDLRLVEALLLEQRAPEHELHAADLVEIVLAIVEEPQRVTRLLLRLLDVAGAQMDLGERGDRARRVGVAPRLEGDAERFLELRDRLVGLAEQEVHRAEVVRQLADEHAVGELFVRRAGALRIRAREHPVALAVGDERAGAGPRASRRGAGAGRRPPTRGGGGPAASGARTGRPCRPAARAARGRGPGAPAACALRGASSSGWARLRTASSLARSSV